MGRFVRGTVGGSSATTPTTALLAELGRGQAGGQGDKARASASSAAGCTTLTTTAARARYVNEIEWMGPHKNRAKRGSAEAPALTRYEQ